MTYLDLQKKAQRIADIGVRIKLITDQIPDVQVIISLK